MPADTAGIGNLISRLGEAFWYAVGNEGIEWRTASPQFWWLIGNLERDSARLVEVRDALRRINAGTFGFCVGCEENINLKRLAAVPWASFCIVCQEAVDREKSPWSEIDTSLVMAA